MANLLYNSFKGKIGDGSISWPTASVKVALVTSAYVPDIDTHTTFATHVTNEVVATGYTAGGIALANKTVTVDTVNDLAKYDADDITWPSSTITARAAVIYEATSGHLIAYIDFVTDQVSTGGNFTINWHADGIFKLA